MRQRVGSSVCVRLGATKAPAGLGAGVAVGEGTRGVPA